MSRQDEIDYANQRGLPINPRNSKFSVDENLWGRSCEAGELEDPWLEPPEEAYDWTNSIEQSPSEPAYVELGFDQGLPVSVDGEQMGGIDIINHLNTLAGSHGVGRIDHVENRLVGHQVPGNLRVSGRRGAARRTQGVGNIDSLQGPARTKARIAQEYADLVYNGLWFTAHRQDLDAYVGSTQRYVTGEVKVRLHKGSCTVAGRKAAQGLYQHSLATYDKGDQFDHSSAQGFISIYGLPVRTQNQVQPR